jgi:hypothetical protein
MHGKDRMTDAGDSCCPESEARSMLRAQSLITTRRSRTEESLIHLYEQLSRARQKFRRLCAREYLRSGRQTSTPSNFPRPYEARCSVLARWTAIFGAGNMFCSLHLLYRCQFRRSRHRTLKRKHFGMSTIDEHDKNVNSPMSGFGDSAA